MNKPIVCFAFLIFASQVAAGEAGNLPSTASSGVRAAADRCDKGDAKSCAGLGVAFMTGSAGAIDSDRGYALVARGCSQSSIPDADFDKICFLAVPTLLNTKAANGSDPRARALWEIGATRKNPLASSELANVRRSEPDPKGEVATLFETACNGGISSACREAGDRLVLLDPARGVPLLEKDCFLGSDASLCARVSSYYAEGQLVAANPAKALSTAEKACTIAGVHALERVNSNGLMVTPEDLISGRYQLDTSSPECVRSAALRGAQ